MRILHVVPTYLPAVRYGGPIFAVHSLCRALHARGHEVHVFTTNVDGNSKTSVRLDAPTVMNGVLVHYFPCPIVRRLYWSPALGLALRRDILGYDVIHLHSVFLWPTSVAAHLAQRNKIPYVISPRGMLIKELIRRKSSIAKLAWIRLFERKNIERASAVHLTSGLERLELLKFGWSLPRTEIIPNGIDEPLSYKVSLGRDLDDLIEKKPLTLFLGRLNWKKGLDRLLFAFAKTQTGHLAIVGPDEDGYASKISELVRKLNLQSRVFLVPRSVVGDEKETLFAAAASFVLPSYSENFGNAVLEAMVRGVPVIVTPEVGAADIVRESGGGFVVDGNPDSLSKALTQLMENEALGKGMGEAGRQHVRSQYKWNIIAADIENLYRACVSNTVEIGNRPGC
jgi:glycosyltransferase involved in cell wall biosynthesis